MIRNKIAAAFAVALLWALPAHAANELVTPGSPLSMATLATHLNTAFSKTAGCWSGTSAPAPVSSAPVTYQCWVDTTGSPRLYKIYDGASWLTIGRIDTSGHTWTPVIASIFNTGTLTLPTSTDTLVGRATTDTFTNKTFDTAGTGNSFSINGLAATANTGTGAVARAVSPAFTTPNLGTPSAATLTNATGCPVGSCISGLGTNVAAALATPSSANLRAALTDETGTGPAVFGTSPVLDGTPDVQGALKLSSFVTSTQITAAQNNYTATDGSNTCTTKQTLRVSSDASRNVTGLSCSQAEGDLRLIHNVGAQDVVLKNQDAASTAANRFLFGGDVTLAANYSITLRYDGVASRWRAITTATAGGGGGGTVTSVAIVGTGLNSTSGTCTVTTSGTCTILGAFPAKYWTGGTHSNNVGTPNTKIDISAFSGRDSTDAFNLVTASTKTIDAGSNGAVDTLDTGTLANSTWYYTFIIAKTDNTSGSLASLSASAPTLPTGYSYFRRVGAFKTDGSAHILPFTHVNDTWYWTTAPLDINVSNASTTDTAIALSVPRVAGIKVFGGAGTSHGTLQTGVWIYPGFLATTARDAFLFIWPTLAGGNWTIAGLATDTSGQVKYRASNINTTITFVTGGWVDPL